MLRVSEQYSGTDTGRQRRANEDALLARAPLYVVADGMGGAQAGEVASQLAVESLRSGIGGTEDPERSLSDRIQEANARIHTLSRSNPEQAGMGTTLTALYVGADSVSLAHVGDSRAYLLRDGQLSRLTHDHSLVDELIRQGRLTPAEAQDHPQRSVITRALGPEPTVEVDTVSYPGSDGDVYLVCSDGLTTMVTEEQVAAILNGHSSLHDAGEALLAAANEAGGRDNITVVLVRLESLSAEQPGAQPLEAPAVPVPTVAPTPPGAVQTATNPGDNGAGEPAGTATVTGVQRPVVALRPRRAPTGGGGRRSRRRPRAGLVVALIILGLLIGGGALAIQSVYFIGTNSRGFVTVYTGLPYQLPGGIKLYASYYVSGVPATTVPRATRLTLLNNSWRSESKVTELLRDLELGQLAGQ
jgi:protein phosphatase